MIGAEPSLTAAQAEALGTIIMCTAAAFLGRWLGKRVQAKQDARPKPVTITGPDGHLHKWSCSVFSPTAPRCDANCGGQ